MKGSKKMLRHAAIAVGALVSAGCSVVGVRAGTPQPSYDVLSRVGAGVEIRRYAPRLAAEVAIPEQQMGSSEGRAFQRLAGYIFGGNRSRDSIAMTSPVEASRPSRQIAMTAPVESAIAGDTYRMRFFLPDGYTLASAPVPNDRGVTLIELDAEIMAVLRFSGSRSDAAVAERSRELLLELQATGWRPRGEPVAYFYDPPWTLPAARRNEVAVAVTAD